MFKKIFFFLLILFQLSPGLVIGAEDKSVSLDPYIIDQKVKARDIIEENIKIKNNTDNKLTLYAIVNDVTPEGGTQEFINPSDLDKSSSLARWIEIQRGVIEINAKQEVSIPLRIKVSMYAVPGKRYATIAFSNSANRYDAEATAKTTDLPKLNINLEVADETVEKAELTTFRPEQTIFFQQPASLYLEIKNIGNRESTPTGTIRIYDRRGVEKDSININPEQTKVATNDNYIFRTNWTDKNGLGKYKAKLEVEYGTGATRDLQDVVYFWILPWKYLVGFIVVFLILFILLVKSKKGGPKKETIVFTSAPANNKVIDLKPPSRRVN